MRKILERCPTCGGEMEVTRLSCPACETVVLGRYEMCSFCKLSPDSLRFVEAFVRTRGNLKEMERDLGQSYWSLRARLDDIVRELGYAAGDLEARELSERRHEILERLSHGEITAAEATDLLAALGSARHA